MRLIPAGRRWRKSSLAVAAVRDRRNSAGKRPNGAHRAPLQSAILATVLCLFGAALPAVAQIEKQAETYDLTLADCLTQTLTRNPDIQRLRVDVERALGDRLVYRSRVLPQLAAQVQGGGRYGTLYSPEGPFGILSAQFSQPLVDVGIPPTLRRGRLEVVAAQQSFNREVTERLHEAQVTFLQALYLRDLIALHEEIDQRLQANVASEQQRYDVGTGSEGALAWAKIQRLNLARDLADLRGRYFSAVTRLAELCGREPTETTNGLREVRLPKPVGTLRYQPLDPNWTELTTYALQHRADLKLLQALVDAAENDKLVTRAGYFPFISLTASGLFLPENALLSKQSSVVPGQDTRTTEVRSGVAMTWRVIDNGQVTGASRRAEATRQGYAIALDQLKQNVPRELAGIESNLQDADARRAALLESATAAEENLKMIEAQVAVGQATQFDFLKAQGNLLSVRAGLVDATYAHEAARADLDRATGRYLEYRTEVVR
ncbi:MAG TPA: TolC family protein [Verrucomicrobiae bacterium]|nr:TolC family protein [Verrucomicrobiae bacterium]